MITKDELLTQLLRFVGSSLGDSLTRQLIYYKIKALDINKMFPAASAGFDSGLLYAFVYGIQAISSDEPIDEFDRRLGALADELFNHLKAELS